MVDMRASVKKPLVDALTLAKEDFAFVDRAREREISCFGTATPPGTGDAVS